MSASGARILLVDDEPAIRRALRTNLHAHGFDVDTAESGADALEAHERARPDVVVLDLGLPGDVDGLEASAAFASARTRR